MGVVNNGRELDPYFTKILSIRGVIRKSENCSATKQNELRQLDTTARAN